MRRWSLLDRWLLIFGVLGLLFFMWLNWDDPTLREPGTVSRDAAVEQASALWKARGVDVSGLQVNATLTSDTMTDGYLGRNGLHQQFQDTAPKEAPVVTWHVIFYQKTGSESYSAHVDPLNGKVVSYGQYGVADRTALDYKGAGDTALAALGEMGLDTSRLTPTVPDHLDQLDPKSDTNVAVFAWKVDGWKLQDLTLNWQVTVQGDHVTGVSYAYDVPRDFIEWKKSQTGIGTLLTFLSFALTFVLFVLAFVFLFRVKGKKPLRTALLLSLTVFVLMLVSNLNTLPAMASDTLESGTGALERYVDSAIAVGIVGVLALLVAAATYPMIVTGGLLVQEVNPRLWTPWRNPGWADVMRKAVYRGYALAFVWLALQAVFYWAGETLFGVWGETDYTMSPINNWVPALFPAMGWMAGIQEELAYRMFGVTFFKRYGKNTFVATLIPAMVWALGHSLYSVYPIYTRFVELTIFGVIIGYCYLWFGIEAVIFAHVVFDVVQMALPMLFSGAGDQVAAGVLFLISPVLVGYGLIALRSLLDSRKPSVESV